MNKLTKKVVSLLTILAFLLTMAPVAAFADEPGTAEDVTVKLTLDKVPEKGDKTVNATIGDIALKKGKTGDAEELLKDSTAKARLVVTAYGAEEPKETVVIEHDALKTALEGEKKLNFADLKDGLEIGDQVKVEIFLPKTDTEKETVLANPVVAIVPPVDGAFAPNSNGSAAVLSEASEKEAAELDTDEKTEFKFVFKNEYSGAVYIWAEKEGTDQNNQPHEKFVVLKGKDAKKDINAADIKKFDNIYYVEEVTTDERGDGVAFSVTFPEIGNYRVYASTVDPRNKNEGDGNVVIGENFFKKRFKNTPPKLEAKGEQNKAVVSKAKDEIEGFGITPLNVPKDKQEEEVVKCGGIFGLNKDDEAEDPCCENNKLGVDIDKWVLVDVNDTTKSKVKAVPYKNVKETKTETKTENDEIVKQTVYIGENTVGEAYPVELFVDKPAIKVNGKTSDTVKTNRHGEVEFAITGDKVGEYFVTIKAGDCSVKVPVKVVALRANTIEKVDSPENPIAAGDVRNANYFSFRVLDVNNNPLIQPFKSETPIQGMDGLRNQFKVIKNQVDERLRGPIYGTDVSYDGDFFRILKQPEKAKLKQKHITISSDKDEELFFVNFNKDLVVGDYAFEVRLDNGEKVVYEFTVKEFGKATKLELSYPTKHVELGYSSDPVSVKFIDENGVEKDASRHVSLGANGYALKAFDHNTGKVTVKNDEKYLGDVITVTAIAPVEGLVADTTLTVTDGKGGNETLTFDKKSGPVNKVHRVKVQVVDSKGNEIALGNDKVIRSMDVVIGEKSNKDATVTANIDSASKSSLQEDGTAELIVKSDKPTTADMKVTIVAQSKKKGAIHTTFYRGTLHYEFTDNAEFAGRNLVMTINSKDVIVDGKIVTIDAAPIIKEKRTFVPYRALAEAFGAKVDWDGEKRTVTAEMDGKKVVMTIDKAEYTNNGEEAKMDVAPFIQGDRTMIPIRFAAQALGFKVTPTYNADGTTASVVFNK